MQRVILFSMLLTFNMKGKKFGSHRFTRCSRFLFSSQVFQIFVEILFFGFHLVNSKCGPYQAVGPNLVFTPNVSTNFESNLGPNLVLKPPFSIHIFVWFSFSFYFWIYQNFVINFPQLVNVCLSNFNLQCMLLHANQIDIIIRPYRIKLMRFLLSAQMFLLDFYPWHYIPG